MATIRPDYYVLWNTDNEGEKYYIAEKTGETSKYIYVKYDVAGNETSYFKKDDVNNSKSEQGLYNVLTSEQWAAYILVEMQDAYYNPPEGAIQSASQKGGGRKRKKGGRKTHRKRKKKTRRRKTKRRKTKKRKTKKRKKKRRTKKAGVIPRQSIKPGSRGLTDKEQGLRMYHKKKQDFKKERKKTTEIQDKLSKSIQKLKSANKSRNLPNISPLTITPSPRPMKMTEFMTSPMTTPVQSPKTGGRKKRRTRRKKGGGDFYMVAFGNPPTKYWVQPQNEDGDIKVRRDPYVLYEFKEIKTDEPLKPIKLLEVKLVDGKKQYIVKNIAMPKK